MPDRVLKPETRDRLLLAMADALAVLVNQAYDGQPNKLVYRRLLNAFHEAETQLQPTNEEEPNASTPERN